ncbi:MAG: SRPBCC family protein [Haloarculaceae archaeon]
MREVEVSRFVRATPAELERYLSPAAIIEHEGTFTVVDSDDGQVTARGGGMEVVFAFEERDTGYRYRQVGDRGPFETMTTTLTYEPENEGSTVRARSSVSLGLPVASVTDRVAAWKRRGELRRALEELATAFE